MRFLQILSIATFMTLMALPLGVHGSLDFQSSSFEKQSNTEEVSCDLRAPASETTRNRRNRSSSRRRTRSCPFGVGPMNHRKCSSRSKNDIIKRLLGSGAADCYSKLFVAESGTSCSVNRNHNARVAKNPHAGFGICAIETSRRIRQRNGRGSNCLAGDIFTSFQRQVLCCRDMLEKTNSRYFGTIKCGKTPNCKGLANRGGTVTDSGGGDDNTSSGNSNRFCKVGRYYWPASDCGRRSTNYCRINRRYQRCR